MESEGAPWIVQCPAFVLCELIVNLMRYGQRPELTAIAFFSTAAVIP